MKVVSQALISFTLGTYKDDVLCNILPMHVGDILLGHQDNLIRRFCMMGTRYSFTNDRRKTTLVPLYLKDVFF